MLDNLFENLNPFNKDLFLYLETDTSARIVSKKVKGQKVDIEDSSFNLQSVQPILLKQGMTATRFYILHHISSEPLEVKKSDNGNLTLDTNKSPKEINSLINQSLLQNLLGLEAKTSKVVLLVGLLIGVPLGSVVTGIFLYMLWSKMEEKIKEKKYYCLECQNFVVGKFKKETETVLCNLCGSDNLIPKELQKKREKFADV